MTFDRILLEYIHKHDDKLPCNINLTQFRRKVENKSKVHESIRVNYT